MKGKNYGYIATAQTDFMFGTGLPGSSYRLGRIPISTIRKAVTAAEGEIMTHPRVISVIIAKAIPDRNSRYGFSSGEIVKEIRNA